MTQARWILSARSRALLLAAALFALNAYIARELFFAEFTRQLGSIESAFISFASYTMHNWSDLTWFPLWFGGMPFHNVYQPGLHVTVAAVGTLFHLTPQHAYHLVTASTYCLGPVTLFWFCYARSGWPGYAFAVGAIYSLVSPSALLSHVLWLDSGGIFQARRFQILVEYGEGPHIAAMTLLPLVVLCLYRAAVERRCLYFPLASVALAALVLTNWPGTLGLTMAVAAFCVSEAGERRLAWLRLGAIAVVAYLLACRWIPPSTVTQVPRNAQQSDGSFHAVHLLYLAGIALVLAGLHFALKRAGVSPFLRFGIYYALISGAVTLGYLWFRVSLLQQPHRFQVEMEMGLAIVACYGVKLLLDRVPTRPRATVLLILLLTAIPIAKSNRRHARYMDAPGDMPRTSEFKMAHAFARLRPTDRVFAPGNISYWMNLWTATPQVEGCCDQSVPDFEDRVANYVIYSGQGTGSRDAEISLLWLRAYGATAVGTDGPRSTETDKPFQHPFKFDGVLPVLWREGDDVIYGIPRRSPSLAHVIPRSAMVTHAPDNGVMTAGIEPYVAALEDPSLPEARFDWTSRHSARVFTSMQSGQVLALQISHDPGWNASVLGGRRPILRDKLGQMVVETNCVGPCQVDLFYDGGVEARWMAVLQTLGLVLACAAPLVLHRKA